MGAFDVFVFDNDEACDHLARLKKSDDPMAIMTATITRKHTDFLEIDDAAELLVTAIVVLGLADVKLIETMAEKGEMNPYFRDEVCAVVAQLAGPDAHQFIKDKESLLRDLINNLEKIMDPEKSEAYQLWSDSKYLDKWLAVVQSLVTSVKSLQ